MLYCGIHTSVSNDENAAPVRVTPVAAIGRVVPDDECRRHARHGGGPREVAQRDEPGPRRAGDHQQGGNAVPVASLGLSPAAGDVPGQGALRQTLVHVTTVLGVERGMD